MAPKKKPATTAPKAEEPQKEKKVEKKPAAKKPADKKKSDKKPVKKGKDANLKPVKTKQTGKPGSAKEKALSAKKAALRGVNQKRIRKVRTTPSFKRPKTLKLPRAPKYPRSLSTKRGLDKYKIVKYPLTTETAMKKIEDNNTLVFIVDRRANKYTISNAVKALYSIEVAKVNTLIRPDGEKKAYVRLPSDYDGLEIASKIGII
ncbi:hypothetical protein SNE40_002599 [Patella caerulea]|uniref:Large ribosomal subunit protein uL23 N-terminal domain-containing protein n=1 Tax=Patella caerulea TaxID=87958 RepID=A0AAN8PZD4_PATCE